VAIDTVVAGSRALFQIPIPVHPAVYSVVVVAALGTVTLGAEGHDVGKLQSRSISQTQGIVITRIVAREAVEIAVGKVQPAVKFIEVAWGPRVQVRLAG